MNKKIIIRISIIVVLIVCVLIVLWFTASEKNVTWNGNVEYFAKAALVIDCTNLYEYVGFADYVFVGTVEDVKNKIISNDDSQIESTYKIHVDNNLKGELVENVICSKHGGFKKDGTMLLMVAESPKGEEIADTGLPELGKQYIFLAYAQPDGSLILSEIFDNREYDENLLVEYLDYVENEIPFERQRFSSKYSK